MKQLIEDAVRALVDRPEEISVTEAAPKDGITTYALTVAEGDLGKVIGKQGRTARSLRTLLGAAAAKANRRCVLEIVE
jgi:hypothetical protein